MYRDKWDTRDPDHNPEYGKITSGGLIAVIREPRWGMDSALIPGALFNCVYANQLTRLGPCVLGYFEPSINAYHVVAIYGASATHVACMDPWGGRFTARPAGYYSRSDRLIIGWPIR